MSSYIDDITISKPVLEMLTVANEYCYFIQNVSNKTVNDVLEFIYRMGPLLYLKGSLIPEVTVQNPEANERFVTAEEWENTFYVLREKMGTKDEFWMIDPQYINENEPIKASLAENLTDIYQDMEDFIMLYQKNTLAARENAVNECRNLFATHWGYRITTMMPKIHHLLHESEQEPPAFLQSWDNL
ncbi:MAG: DUF5063 domain-containing protein [Bacteroidales bacterium]|nr:DUF5063 domain-containing protein [Bacteroidales bacterium]